MKVVVITSVYNGIQFLPQCLASVRRAAEASSLDVFHLVIDAASKDGSLDLLEEWKLKLGGAMDFISEPDQGQSDGFNKGIHLADTDWVCWLNGDDELPADAFQNFSDALRKNPDADCIYGHIDFIDEQSHYLKTVYTLPYTVSLIFNNLWLPPTSGTFFRRHLFLKEPLDVSYHFVMDVEWFLRCGKTLQGVLVDKVMSRFRVSAGGKTSPMIQSGVVNERHQQERQKYRRQHIYSQWPALTEEQASSRFVRRQKIAKIQYYWLKSRFVLRYIRQRFLR